LVVESKDEEVIKESTLEETRESPEKVATPYPEEEEVHALEEEEEGGAIEEQEEALELPDDDDEN